MAEKEDGKSGLAGLGALDEGREIVVHEGLQHVGLGDLLLGRAVELPYHDMILLVVVVFVIAGAAALQIVIRGAALEAASGWRTAVASLCVVFSLVGGQLAWALRPYLVRPRTPDVPFVRTVDGSLYDAITGSVQSARGIYTRDEAPLGTERGP